jgi:hypothetical protein
MIILDVLIVARSKIITIPPTGISWSRLSIPEGTKYWVAGWIISGYALNAEKKKAL